MWQLPRESRVFNKLQPQTQWGWQEVFLNKIVFYLETIAWQNATPSEKGKKAHHKSLQPKLFVPDFMPQQPGSGDVNKGLVAADTDTIKDLLARKRK